MQALYRVTEQVKRIAMMNSNRREFEAAGYSMGDGSDPEAIAKSIRAAAAERVAAYREMRDTARLDARETVLGYCRRYSIEEVRCWLDEAKVERMRR